jgi:hypothetical protein
MLRPPLSPMMILARWDRRLVGRARLALASRLSEQTSLARRVLRPTAVLPAACRSGLSCSALGSLVTYSAASGSLIRGVRFDTGFGSKIVDPTAHQAQASRSAGLDFHEPTAQPPQYRQIWQDALPTTSWIVGRRLKLIFARISTADAPGVPFDLSQCGVERGVRPSLYAGHSFRGVALWMDHELTGRACRDAPHRAAEQVRQPPNCASLCRCDDQIHSEPSACTPREQTVAITDGRTTEFRGHSGHRR